MVLDLLAGGRFVQVGILVPDLHKALDDYTRAFGLGPWIGFHFTRETVQDFTYRGQPVDYSIDIALTGEGPQVELVQVHGEASLYHEWIEAHGYGVQHLGARVDDIAEARDALLSQGYELLQSGHGYGRDGDGAFAFFDTLADFGFLLEVIQVPKVRRDADFVWPPTG